MAGNTLLLITAAGLLVLQEISCRDNASPLVPRLKYSTNGRQLDEVESITRFLAQYNVQGFPVELFYRSLEEDLSLAHQPSMDEIAEALHSAEIRNSLEEAALDHFADVLNEPEAHDALKYSGKEQRTICSYSWLSWLPWLSCPTESRSTTGEISPQELYASCLEPKFTHINL